MNTPLERQESQALAALQVANQTRYARANLKREVVASDPHAGRERLTEVILNPPQWARTWPLADALCILPRFGTSKAASVCHRAHALPTRRLGDLSDRQRAVIALALSNQSN